MWFNFNKKVRTCFWMMRTPMPLDLILVDEEGKITEMIKGMRPHDRTPICPKKSFYYALEMRRGSAENYGFQVGDRLVVEKTVKGMTNSNF